MAQFAKFVVPPCAPSSLSIANEAAKFAVRRVYCVGRNYRAHAVEMEQKQKEMGISAGDQTEDPPFFFQKPAYGAIVDVSRPGAVVRYPPKTARLEHELELVVALKSGGAALSRRDAAECVFGAALGVDLTRRDLQHDAKRARRPWDAAKGFDDSAPVGALARIPAPPDGALTLTLHVNDAERQACRVDSMIYDVAGIIHHLSEEVQLEAGDVIFAGTPAGVAPLVRGDVVDCRAMLGGADFLPRCTFTVA